MEQLGSSIIGEAKDKILFKVYAQNRSGVKVLISHQERFEQIVMHQQQPGLYSVQVERLSRAPLYKFILEGEEGAYPDPCSHYQPEGVHGFSQVVDHERYRWSDGKWSGINWPEAIVYELHIGAFSKEGTFRSAEAKLDTLIELGINTIELMPVTQTPGRWNWGYDGVNLFSVNHTYGSPDDFKHFVDTCHSRGLAVLLDLVCNHFGPEGTYLQSYWPYFTAKYNTAWGAAVNYDDEGCAVVRQMVLESVRHWVERYHLDGLRLDAVHAIHDQSTRHILREIAETALALSAIKQAVSEGRKKEFTGFGWVDPPDPEDDDSFYRSKLTPREKWKPRQQQIFAYYRDLIRLRLEHPALRQPDKKALEIKADPRRRLVRIVRRGGGRVVVAYINLGETEAPLKPGSMDVIFDSEAPQYGGRGDVKSKAPETLWPGQFVLAEPKGPPE